MSNLLPCPFCGPGENGELTEIHIDCTEGWWSVNCVDCGAEKGFATDEADAVAKWNTRHAPTASTTQQAAAAVLAAQEAKGLSKYGTTLDTANLSLLEIAQHYQQEAADALMYATAMVELMKKEATNV